MKYWRCYEVLDLILIESQRYSLIGLFSWHPPIAAGAFMIVLNQVGRE